MESKTEMNIFNRLLTYASLACLPIGAMAEDEIPEPIGLYIGAEGGYSDIELNQLDDSEAYKAYAGYYFVEAFGVEAGYGYLGEFDVNLPGASSSIEVEDVYQAAVVFSGPLLIFDNGRIHARYGYYQATVTPNSTNTTTDSIDASSFTYALGLSYPIFRPISVSFNYQFYNDIESESISTYSLGLRADF